MVNPTLMTGRDDYDVAVVGGSLAGCTAATFFGRRGLKVALIERRSDPQAYKKICTHFIQPSATPTLERLGLASEIETAGGIRNSMETWTQWGWIRPFPDGLSPSAPYGFNIRRKKLDPMLRSLATKTPGVEFMPGYTARQLIEHSGRVAGVTIEDKSGRARSIRTQLVVAADGRDSTVANLAGLKATINPNVRFVYFAYYAGLPLARGNTTQIWFMEPEGASLFPNDDGLTLLSCALPKNRLAEFKQNIEDNFVRFFEKIPEGPPIHTGERVSEIRGTLDMPNILRPTVRPGLALVGDAAMTSDPLLGVGCGWAFQTAEWLVDCTAEALLHHEGLDQALKTYHTQHRSKLYGHHLYICLFSRRHKFSLFEKTFFKAATNDQTTARHLHAATARLISPREFIKPSAIARAMWMAMRQ